METLLTKLGVSIKNINEFIIELEKRVNGKEDPKRPVDILILWKEETENIPLNDTGIPYDYNPEDKAGSIGQNYYYYYDKNGYEFGYPEKASDANKAQGECLVKKVTGNACEWSGGVSPPDVCNAHAARICPDEGKWRGRFPF